jgi:hypothetical protein
MSQRRQFSHHDSNSRNNAKDDDAGDDEDDPNDLWTSDLARLSDAWWSVGRSFNSPSSDLLANAPLSPKVHALLFLLKTSIVYGFLRYSFFFIPLLLGHVDTGPSFAAC